MSREERRDGLREIMARHGLGAVLLSTYPNFAWYTGGADNRVDHSSPVGVASILLTPEAEHVLTDNIEAPRMREEQTPGIEVVEHPWHEGPGDLLNELTGGASLGADHPHNGARDISDAVGPLRYVLDEAAVRTYREVGGDAAAALQEAANNVSPEMTEGEAAANVVSACRARNLFAPVLFAASDARVARFRHPIPLAGAALGSRVMLVVCAERGGLYANLTRWVRFEEQTDRETQRRQAACEEILRRMREEACRPGSTLADAFADCQRFYAEAGYPDGWRGHHQGGLTGYATREVVASPSTNVALRPGMAFAWNPSLPGGAKAEETFVLTETGPEVLT